MIKTTRWTLAGVLALGILGITGTASAGTDPVPEPSGYRLDDYRAPTPATVTGGHAIATAQAASLWHQGKAVFIDVLPAPHRPKGLRTDALWKPLPRRDIPGSLWLPDVGRGVLNPALESYFRDNLARATHGDKATPVVLYCLAECWMSWNATKRAASWGYTQLYWYRDGTNGWDAAHLPMTEAKPAPGWP